MLTIDDDGAGFDAEAAPRGQGIANMRSRAAECRGYVNIEGLEKGGTRVELEIPSLTPDRAEARTYGKNALIWGVVAAVMWYYIVFPKPGQEMLELRAISLPVAVMASAICVRDALAFLRSRRSPEVRP
jgi:hypothetical protein